MVYSVSIYRMCNALREKTWVNNLKLFDLINFRRYIPVEF